MSASSFSEQRVESSHSLTAPRPAHIRERRSFSDCSLSLSLSHVRHGWLCDWGCYETHYGLHDVVPGPGYVQPRATTITSRLSKWDNSQDLAKSDWLVLFSSRHLRLTLQNIPRLNRFEGRRAIIVMWQQNIFSLLNGCFCGYWCVFSGMIGSSWTGNWERAADGVPCVPHHYPIIVTKLPCKFP